MSFRLFADRDRAVARRPPLLRHLDGARTPQVHPGERPVAVRLKYSGRSLEYDLTTMFSSTDT